MSKDKSEKKNWFIKHKILTIIGAIILLFIIIGAASGSKSNVNTVTPSNNSGTSTPTKPAETKKVSLLDFYDQVQNGMIKTDVEALAGGIKPTMCSETQMQGIGTISSCTYGGFLDKGSVSIVYTNGSVSSKSKYEF